MDIYEKARNAVKEAFAGNWERVYETFNMFLAGDMKHFARVPSPFVEWEEVFEPVAKATVFAMSMMPLQIDSSVYTPFIGDVTFYDVAEGLMSAYVFGRFSVHYMPRARIIMQTGKHIDVAPVEKFLEELEVMKNGTLTGVGQALAKALIHGAVHRTSTVPESVYLSALIAYTLHVEMRQLSSESIRTLLLEAIARYKRITTVIKEWQKTAPKLYLREIPIFYSWEDAVKDIALTIKKEDFRFTI
jgi:hypothetical protein